MVCGDLRCEMDDDVGFQCGGSVGGVNGEQQVDVYGVERTRDSVGAWLAEQTPGVPFGRCYGRPDYSDVLHAHMDCECRGILRSGANCVECLLSTECH
jgi:hypothetical protein